MITESLIRYELLTGIKPETSRNIVYEVPLSECLSVKLFPYKPDLKYKTTNIATEYYRNKEDNRGFILEILKQHITLSKQVDIVIINSGIGIYASLLSDMFRHVYTTDTYPINKEITKHNTSLLSNIYDWDFKHVKGLVYFYDITIDPIQPDYIMSPYIILSNKLIPDIDYTFISRLGEGQYLYSNL